MSKNITQNGTASSDRTAIPDFTGLDPKVIKAVEKLEARRNRVLGQKFLNQAQGRDLYAEASQLQNQIDKAHTKSIVEMLAARRDHVLGLLFLNQIQGRLIHAEARQIQNQIDQTFLAAKAAIVAARGAK